MRNRPDVSSNELLNEVTSNDDCASKMKHAFTIPDTSSSVVVSGGTNSSQCFYRCGKRISRPIIARNRRHVYLHIKPVRAPIFCEIGLAARRDLNSRKPLLCILPVSIESAASVVSLIILTIADLDDVGHDV
jgi:hypothetical protein